MSAQKSDDEDVHRLHEILVEEVSLVDHAANKHRFLIVKRSHDMDDNTDNTDNDDAIIDIEDDDANNDDDAPGDNDTEGEGHNSDAMSLTVEALEGLTKTVELLSNANDEDAQPQLAELATELRSVSDSLASMAGADDDSDSADAAKNSSNSDNALAGTLSAVRATLQQVGNTLRSQSGGSKPKTADDKRSKDSGSKTANNLSGQLESLTGELRTLTTTVKEQQQRIARLEKRAGLPNSKPVGEKRKRVNKSDKDSQEGWPMDMNRSLDRDSVDKSVSFHDV